MKKKISVLRIVVIVIIVLETIVLAGCNTVNNTANINSSYDAIKAAYANNSSNSEVSFIYDAINNKISEYPKIVPDFINLPVDSIVDAIDKDKRINIEYADDDNYQNGIIIAQEPKAGAAWDDGVIVNLTVNRKYRDIKSQWGYMSESLDKLYLLTNTDIAKGIGQIWSYGEKLADGEMIKLYVDNGNVYYNDRRGVNKLDAEGASQVLGKYILTYTVINEKIYYVDRDTDGKLYCYNMNDKSNSPVTNEPVMFFYVNSDYIVCWNPHDIFIVDNESYKLIKAIHYKNTITGCSLDKDNVYFVQTTFNDKGRGKSEIIKYNIKQDTQITVSDSGELVSNILAIDDKIVFFQYLDNQIGIKYMDMRNMENEYFTSDDDISDMNDDVIDILFDGQQIIYEKEDRTFYSICIFTGETKKIDLPTTP